MNNPAQKSLVIGFCILISMPLILQLFGIQLQNKNIENSKIPEFPKFTFHKKQKPIVKQVTSFVQSLNKYIKNIENYSQRNFFARNFFFSIYREIKLNLFKTNPIPNKVIEGNEGWYFLGDSYSNTVKESKGLITFSKEDLERIGSTLTKRKTFLDKRGIHYFFAVAPNKHTVYGDYLSIKKSSNKTKLEQLLEYSDNIPVHIVDLKSKFPSNQYYLFHKTNTHWNDLGAFYGYLSLMEPISKIYKDIPILSLDDFDITIDTSYQEDLTKMLQQEVLEKRVTLIPKTPFTYKDIEEKKIPIPKNYKKSPSDYEKRYTTKNKKLKVLIFRDSYGSAFLPFISETFGETLFIWAHHFNEQLIEQEKPDIVIHEIVERNLDMLSKSKK